MVCTPARARRVCPRVRRRGLGGSTCPRRCRGGRTMAEGPPQWLATRWRFVLKRADGHWAYHLAVVVDDADQASPTWCGCRPVDVHGGTHGVATGHELHTPEYVHVPWSRTTWAKSCPNRPAPNRCRLATQPTCWPRHVKPSASPFRMWMPARHVAGSLAPGMCRNSKTGRSVDLLTLAGASAMLSSALSLLGWNLVTWSFRNGCPSGCKSPWC